MASAAALLMAAHVASAQAPSPMLLVAIGHENSVVVVAPATGKVLRRAPTDDDSHSVVGSTDGKLAFTGNMLPSTISVVDLTTGKELRRVNTGPGSRPHDVVYRNGKVYFTAGGYKAVGRYDPAANQIDWLVGTGQNGTNVLVVTQNGDKLFVSNRDSNTVSIVEDILAAPKWNVTNLQVGGSPEGLDISPDDREVWAAKRFGGGISIIDVATKKITQLDVQFGKPTEGSAATRLSFTPDGRRVVLLHRPTQDVVVFDAASRKELKRIKVPGSSVLISPDSSKAYISVEASPAVGDGYIAVIDLKALELAGKIVVPPGPPAPCKGACDTMALAWTMR